MKYILVMLLLAGFFAPMHGIPCNLPMGPNRPGNCHKAPNTGHGGHH